MTEVLILYGSQTGNSESAAHEIASQFPTKLTPLINNSAVKPTVMTLDDFLEMHHAPWKPIIIIVCSSYGVGQAPLGARRFREVCDALLERHGYDASNGELLNGVQYFLLGLGDSHYTTFFRNPTVMNEALTACGAVRRGVLGKADASGTGENEQGKVIERWVEGMWNDLAKAVNELKSDDEQLKKAQEETWKLCLELFEDWRPAHSYAFGSFAVPVVMVVLAVLYHFLVQNFN
jgi:sulfite reductase alpha subunit-like flavoprotein